MKIRLTVGDDGVVQMQTPFNPRFVEEFRAVVPDEARSPHAGLGWNPETKVWSFTEDYLDDPDGGVVGLLDRFFPGWTQAGE